MKQIRSMLVLQDCIPNKILFLLIHMHLPLVRKMTLWRKAYVDTKISLVITSDVFVLIFTSNVLYYFKL